MWMSFAIFSGKGVLWQNSKTHALSFIKKSRKKRLKQAILPNSLKLTMSFSQL